MTKKIMILGAGRGQVGLIEAAKARGYYVAVATTRNQKYPGLALADEVLEADISSPDAVLEVAKAFQPDGIATSCMDTGVTSVGRVCDALHLCGLTETAAALCQDKYTMKQAFMEHGVQTARFLKIGSVTELEDAFTKLDFPLIIKATDLQGSRGIYIVHDEAEAKAGFVQTMQETKRDYCIVEEFIEGNEFGAQAFVYNNEIYFVLPHDDDTYMSHTAVPVGHSVPMRRLDELGAKADVAVRAAIHALGLNNCAVNVDMIEKDGEVYMIELTGRVGANGLPEMTSIYWGFNYYSMIAAMAVGDDPATIWKQRPEATTAAYAEMLFVSEGGGVVQDIGYKGPQEDNIYDLRFFVEAGDTIRIFENSADCIGQLIVSGETIDECLDHISRVKKEISIEYR